MDNSLIVLLLFIVYSSASFIYVQTGYPGKIMQLDLSENNWEEIGNHSCNYWQCSGFNSQDVSNPLIALSFNFSIPSNATISKIIVNWTKKSVQPMVVVDTVSTIIKSTSDLSSNYASKDYWTQSWEAVTYPTDLGDDLLWGNIWTPSDINNPNFGALLEIGFFGAPINSTKQQFAEISCLTIQVYYYFGCAELSSCSNHGICNTNNLCDCVLGYYGDDCSTLFGESSSDYGLQVYTYIGICAGALVFSVVSGMIAAFFIRRKLKKIYHVEEQIPSQTQANLKRPKVELVTPDLVKTTDWKPVKNSSDWVKQ